MRESIPRQVDNKSEITKEEKRGPGTLERRYRSGILKEEERTTFFYPLHSFFFFFL